jgi:hypothetical protein
MYLYNFRNWYKKYNPPHKTTKSYVDCKAGWKNALQEILLYINDPGLRYKIEVEVREFPFDFPEDMSFGEYQNWLQNTPQPPNKPRENHQGHPPDHSTQDS